jgi:hypothetical protein
MSCRSWSTARVCLALGISVFSTGIARAEDVKTWFSQVTINAFTSVSYQWDFNKPDSKLIGLRGFDYDHNSFRLDAAEIVLQKAVSNPGEFGFRLDVAFGPVAKVAAARGLFRDTTTGVAGDIDLQQAYASYIVPIGKGLRIDAGKFVTPVGAEYIDGYDGYNDNFSRSFLFTWAIPFTHTGFKLSYPFSDKLAVMIMLINGWDNVVDNNAAKSFGVNFTITPIAPLSIYLTYIGGPERDNQDTDFRHLLDFGLVWKPHWRVAVTVNVDYGCDQNAVLANPPAAGTVPTTMDMTTPPVDTAGLARKNAQWAGAALYVRVAATHRLAFIARGELFYDFDGFRTGTAQRLMELTLTPEFKVTDAFLLRGEFRIDQSDQRVFEREGGLTRRYQPTLALNALYAF